MEFKDILKKYESNIEGDSVKGLSDSEWIEVFQKHKELARKWAEFNRELVDVTLGLIEHVSIDKDNMEQILSKTEDEKKEMSRGYLLRVWELSNIMHAVNSCGIAQEYEPIFNSIMDKVYKQYELNNEGN